MKSVLQIKTCVSNGRSILEKSHFTPPFKLADITVDRMSRSKRLMIMSSSPGILDGDEQEISMHIGEGTSVQVETQGYQRLFAMKQGARQIITIVVEKQAALVYVPHPLVPHAASSFFSHNKIYIDKGSSLYWGEVFTCGRKLNGEQFSFTCFQNITEVFLQGKLVVKENIVLQPGLQDLLSVGQFEGYTHQATLVVIDDALDLEQATIWTRQLLEAEQDISSGVTELAVRGIIIRILGQRAEQLFHCLQEITGALQSSKFKKSVKEIKAAYGF